jgi:hypothetical protein
MTEASEEQIAALREDVRSAGDAVRRVRLAFVIGAAVCFTLGLISAGGMVAEFVGGMGFSAAWIAMTGIGAAWIWYLERGRLRLLLRALPAAQQAEVLLPLRAAPRLDTRSLARSLLRELQPRNEPTPAAAPAGRGNEPTPPGERG